MFQEQVNVIDQGLSRLWIVEANGQRVLGSMIEPSREEVEELAKIYEEGIRTEGRRPDTKLT